MSNREAMLTVGLAGLLKVARLREREPRKLVVLGMQLEAMELGWDLSEPVAAHLEALVDAAIVQLRLWGVPVIERARDLDKGGGRLCTR